MSANPKVFAIVPAAGVGQRMGQSVPKQYLSLNGRPILAHTLDVICQVPAIKQVIVPLHPADPYWTTLNLPYSHLHTVTGGEMRFQSVLNALTYLANWAEPHDWILVHDAVRPCITVQGISTLLTEIFTHPVGGLWGVPVRDTLKQVDAQQNIVKTVARESLWHALTPQIFRFNLLFEALQQALHNDLEITDEASAIEQLGYHPKMVLGSYANIKITWPEDVQNAIFWLQQQGS